MFRWMHPGLSDLLSSLSQYDNIRYAAYRLSSKLLCAGGALGCGAVPLPLAQSVLAHHGLASPATTLTPAELRCLTVECDHVLQVVLYKYCTESS